MVVVSKGVVRIVTAQKVLCSAKTPAVKPSQYEQCARLYCT
jgi:hypothetical protein